MKNILIILNMNNINSKITKEIIKQFKISFNNNANLFFKIWNDKNLYTFIKKNNINGIILSGSNFRILKFDKNKEKLTNIFMKKILKTNIPILGVCYGFQLLIKYLSNKNCINSFKYNKKYKKILKIEKPFKINNKKYFFNHHDYIVCLPKNWDIIIKYKKIIYMAYNKEKKIIGIQFHPESIKNTCKYFYKKWLNYI
jgi:GMP synthase (glutamine-hydrolysing)